MISGSKSTFAIDYALNEQYGGKWLFGKICYWIGNSQIGDYESGTSMRDLIDFMQGVVDSYEKIIAPDLFNIDHEKAFDLLEAAIFNEDNRIDKYLTSDIQKHMPGLFSIAPPVDVFDECRVYLVRSNDFDKIIYKININLEVRYIQMESGFIKDLFSNFSKWIKHNIST